VTASERAIQKRRLELRGGRSVRQVSRDQWELDQQSGAWGKVANRMSYCRRPFSEPYRITPKKDAA